MSLTAQELRRKAKKLVKSTRANPPHIYTDEEIKASKYPDKPCQLCGQMGCETKYAEQYIHKKCLRLIRKLTKSIQK